MDPRIGCAVLPVSPVLGVPEVAPGNNRQYRRLWARSRPAPDHLGARSAHGSDSLVNCGGRSVGLRLGLGYLYVQSYRGGADLLLETRRDQSVTQSAQRGDGLASDEGRAVVEFDHHSQEFADNWRSITADLRNRWPVAHTEAHGGYWVVSRYEDVEKVALDDYTFSSDSDPSGNARAGRGPRFRRHPCSSSRWNSTCRTSRRSAR